MDGPREIIILSEVRQKEKDKYHMIYHLYVESKYDTNELIYETVTDTENRLAVAKGEEGGRTGSLG